MRRGAKPAKAKVEAKSPRARKSPKNEASTVHELEKRLAEALKREVEAREQQTATSEILRVISQSPTDVQPVLDALVESVGRLCDAVDTFLLLVEGDQLRVAALHPSIEGGVISNPIRRDWVAGRAVMERRTVHVEDLANAQSEFPLGSQIAVQLGHRTALAMPLLRKGAPIGALFLRRREVRPFSDKEIALLQTFADQAVIAIENVRLFNQTKEALEQQTATAEILRVISSSPTDVQPVFDAVAESAARLCEAQDASIFRREGDRLAFVAHHGPIAQRHGDFSLPLVRGTVGGRSVLESRTVQVADLQNEDREFPDAVENARRFGFRTILSVPLLREGIAIGGIQLRRTEVQLFSERQIALLQTFANQAIIAIENVRLFKELEARNSQLSEALEQQTATSEILQSISTSPTDVNPVLAAVARNAARLCDSYDAQIVRVAGDHWESVASYGPVPANYAGRTLSITREGFIGRAILDRAIVHVPDILTVGDEFPAGKARSLPGVRTVLAVPLLSVGAAIGVIFMRRLEVRPFSDTHIELLKTFADQAVIAIENVRLFTELQARNRDLTEALEQQTATAEVLQVISRSTFDLQPVLETLIDNAMKLCNAQQGAIWRFDGKVFRVGAVYPSSPEFRVLELRPGRESTVGRVGLERRAVQILDVLTDPQYQMAEVQKRGGFRTIMGIPMLREGTLIGAFSLARTEVHAFTDKQIELVTTFADQAVIAIENVRLFKELEARTADLTRSVDQLTALGEVGRAVSSTLDLETVLTTIVSRAVELSRLDGGVVFEYDEDEQEFVQRAPAETGGALAAARRPTRIQKGEGVVGRTAITLEPVQVFDITAPGAYVSPNRENLIESGVRAILAVPMVREGQLIGCLGVTRNQPGEFPTEIIELLRTFATQSALAIQNARLFQEIEDKSRQLEAASQHKSEFLANMSHELRTPLNAIIGFSEVLSERMFGDLNEKQEEYLKDIYASGTHLLSLINDILDLSKIEAGRMELELTDFDLPTALDNALTLVRERAGRRQIALHMSIDERLGQVRADERKIRQVVLNLLSNAIKFTPEGGRIEVRAGPVDRSVEVSVTDTGVGIAPEDQDAVFEEFRQVGTAAKKVEGTGLGLTLSRKFVELHGGRIWVKSEVGVGSTFSFTLPVRRGE